MTFTFRVARGTKIILIKEQARTKYIASGVIVEALFFSHIHFLACSILHLHLLSSDCRVRHIKKAT